MFFFFLEICKLSRSSATSHLSLLYSQSPAQFLALSNCQINSAESVDERLRGNMAGKREKKKKREEPGLVRGSF